MNINDALKILNLDIEYTEDDLKREYRKLVIKYHPDKHDKKDKFVYEEKTKLLNEARDVLYRNIKSKNNSETSRKSNVRKETTGNYNNDEELKNLKLEYMREVSEEVDYILCVDSKDKLFMKWKDDFLKEIADFFLCIDEMHDVLTLKISYEYYKKEYFKYICYYLYDCWKNTRILEFAGNLNINMYDGIMSVRDKMIMTIQSILDLEMAEFRLIDNYDELEPLFLTIRNSFVYVCLYGYLNINKVKSELKNKIVLEIKGYNKRKKIIDCLTKYYNGKNKLLVNLSNNLLDEDSFYDLYNNAVDMKIKAKIRIKNMFF